MLVYERGHHALLDNTTHSIGSLFSLFRSPHAPERGVHQDTCSSKVEFEKQILDKTFWSRKNGSSSKMVFSHRYLGWRRRGSFRTMYPTEITHFYCHGSVTHIYIPITNTYKPYSRTKHFPYSSRSWLVWVSVLKYKFWQEIRSQKISIITWIYFPCHAARAERRWWGVW